VRRERGGTALQSLFQTEYAIGAFSVVPDSMKKTVKEQLPNSILKLESRV
jgi:hypothetical protein